MSYPLTIISAPAGYGKTTSLLNALHTLTTPFAWYEPHRQDDTPEQFWAYVVLALQQIASDFGPSLMDEIDQGEIDFTSDRWCELLLNELHWYAQPFFLVIDNFQNLTHAVIHQSLQAFVRYAPDAVHMVLASRTALPSTFNAEQWRPSTYSITADDLQYTLPEVVYFFRQREIELTERELSWLYDKTRGWVISLQAIALVLSKSSHRKSSLFDKFDTATRGIFDYFAEEVFVNLGTEMKTFLSRTGVLDSFSPALADHLVGIQNSAAVLQELSQNNLFLTQQDAKVAQYRYHPLFGAFLRSRMTDTEREYIHEQAAAWYASAGQYEQAVDCALETGNLGIVVPLVKDASYQALNQRKFGPVEKWFDHLPASLLRENADLALAQGWYTMLRGDFLRAREHLARSRQLDSTLWLEQAALHGNIDYLQGNYAAALPNLELCLAHIHDLPPILQLCVVVNIGRSHWLTGDALAAFSVMDRFQTLIWEGDGGLIHAVLLYFYTQILVERGKLHDAQALLDRLWKRCETDSYWDKIKELLQIVRAEIRFHENQVEEASALLEEAIASLHAMSVFNYALVGQMLLTEWMAYGGQVEKSTVQAEALIRLARDGLQSWLLQEAMDVKVIVADCRHDLAAITAWVNQCDPGRVLFSRALGVYCRHIAATRPQEAAIAKIRQCQDGLAVQGLVVKQIDLTLILAQLYVQAKQPEEAKKQVANAVILAFQEEIAQPFVAQGSWLREILGGQRMIAPQFIDRVLDSLPAEEDGFTWRERRFLSYIRQGYSNKAMADELHVSVDTVKFHLKQIFKKLEVSNRMEAAQKIIARNLS